MRIKWYGHAAFMVTRSDGFRIITDPYDPEVVGYSPIRDGADLVITSSDDDEGHCRHDLVPGDHAWLNALDAVRSGGSTTAAGIEVSAVEGMEIESHPLHEPGANAMYRFEVDGVKLAHMGDIGDPLSPRQTDFLRGVDVLMALTGGVLTIDLDELMRVIEETRPKIVIPMHFQTLAYRPRNILWIESFLSRFPEDRVDFAFGCEAEISREALPGGVRVLALDYVR